QSLDPQRMAQRTCHADTTGLLESEIVAKYVARTLVDDERQPRTPQRKPRSFVHHEYVHACVVHAGSCQWTQCQGSTPGGAKLDVRRTLSISRSTHIIRSDVVNTAFEVAVCGERQPL